MPIKTAQQSVLDLRIPGLLHAYNFDTLRDDVTGAIGTLSGPPPRTSTVAGIGRYCSGGNYVSWPITPAVGTIPSSQQGKGVTVFVQLVPVSLISYGAIFRKTTSAFSLSISIHSNGLVNYRGINGSTANWPAGTKYPLAIGKMSTIAYCASGTADRIYVDGKQDGVGVVAAASQSEGTIAFGLGGGGYSAPDIKYIRAFVFDRELSGAEVSKLHASLVNQPQSRILVGFAGDGSASASLTGGAGTSSAGAVVPSLSASISGNYATTSVGALSPSVGATISISGSEATASTGSLSLSVGVVTAGGQVSTASGVSTVGMSNALTGNTSTASAGTLSPSVGATTTLSGSASTTTTGTLAASLSISVAGTSTITSVGTLTLPGSYSAALNANQVSASTGSIAPSVSNAIAGVQIATGVGSSSSVGVSRSATGNLSSTNTGVLAATLSVTVSGTSTSTTAGVLSVPGSYSAALGSSAVASLAGSLAASVSVGVSGTLATTSVGILTRTTAVTGSQTNTTVGVLTVSVTNAITGLSVVASPGSPVITGGSFSASLYGNILTTSSGLLTVQGAIPGPGEFVNLHSRLTTTKALSSPVRRSVSLSSQIPQ